MRRWMVSLWFALPLLALHGQDRALLIGIEFYLAIENADLAGVDRDLANMDRVSRFLGYDHIDVLDKSPTRGDIVRELERLAAVVKPDDRVLLYYTGHGARIPDINGDEKDGFDEILCPADLEIDSRGVRNHISDDELSYYLSNIRAREILVIIDSCHSGTAAKQLGIQEKNLVFSESALAGFSSPTPRVKSSDRLVWLSACADGEKTYTTEEGSFFTRAITFVIRTAAENGKQITPQELIVRARNHTRNISPHHRSTPQIHGNPSRFDDPLFARSTPQQVEAPSSRSLKITPTKPTYSEGEQILLEIQIPFEGYLQIFSFDPAGKITRLFPNAYHPENRVMSMPNHVIPQPSMDFSLRASEPLGKSRILAILSPHPSNLMSASKGSLSNGFVSFQNHEWNRLRSKAFRARATETVTAETEIEVVSRARGRNL